MDRLIAEKETEVATEKEIEVQKEIATEKETVNIPKVSIKLKEKVQPEMPASTEYINSFENMTIADIKREKERKEAEEFKIEKEALIQAQFEKPSEQKASQKVIEKPNYDFIEENKKVVKLKKNTQKKSKSNKKIAGIVLACTLGASALICVANTIVIDNLSSQFIQIDETYQFNLASYLKKIYNLDTTKKSMEMIETYPEDVLDAGDLGQHTNWFDRLCSFLGGLFGG